MPAANCINVYCDESCHLENDESDVMVLGAVWAERDAAREASARIVALKKKHGISPKAEIKWVKVSKSKFDFFIDVVDYFFDFSELHFRCVVIPNKKLLDHEGFGQSHDDWYYKMHFLLLSKMLNQHSEFSIYMDIKDSRSQAKVKKLHDVICTSRLDFDHKIVKKIQQVRSHEVQLLQLGDLLMGAVCYANRQLSTSEAKLAVVQHIRDRSGRKLVASTLASEKKFNVLIWTAKESGL
jgi:hypothetical protein